MIVLHLPMPPSVNSAWRNVAGRGRVKSGAYKAWETEAGWRLRSQRPAMVKGPVRVELDLCRPSGRADVDNRIKPVLDLLTSCNVLDDDSQVVEVTARWAPVAACVVTVREAA